MSFEPTSNGLAEQINKLTQPPEEYTVEWSSATKWDFDAKYDVREFREGEGGKPMMLIEGPKGGEYVIDSNPGGQPVVRYPQGGRTDRLAEIEIYGQELSWRHRIMKRIQQTTGALGD